MKNPPSWSSVTHQFVWQTAVDAIEADEWNPHPEIQAFIHNNLLWMAEAQGRGFCKRCKKPIEFSTGRGRRKEFCDRTCGDIYRSDRVRFKKESRKAWRRDLERLGWPRVLLDPEPIMGQVSTGGSEPSDRLAPHALDYEDEVAMTAAGLQVERKQEHDEEQRFQRDQKKLRKSSAH